MRLPGNGRGLRLLDAGCGTGASTAALLAAAPHAQIVAIDASAEMLAQARAKPWPSSVRFVHAPVEDLGAAGIRGPFDGILAAYLIRNLADPDAQLRALRGLLRPGGTLAVHEYSVRDSAGPARYGARSAGVSSSRPAAWPPATRRCTATCGAASRVSTGRNASGGGCGRPASPGCTARR